MDQMKSAVVTGVSSGIGRAIAKRLVDEGWRVFGSVRKQEDAEAAQDALGEGFTPLVCDVTDEASIAAAAEQVSTALAGRTLDGLVNNAGSPASGPMRYISIDDLKWIMDVNVYGVVRACQAFIPLLGGDPERTGAPGKIINMSSVSGRISVPFMGPYSMSKYALEAISDALRVELIPHGIDVVIVEPGPVKTPIFDKSQSIDKSRYSDTEYAASLERMVESSQAMGKDGLEPEVISDLVWNIFNNATPKTRYAILKKKFSRFILPRLLRQRRVDQVLADRMGLTRSS